MNSKEYIGWIMDQPQNGFSMRLADEDHIIIESASSEGEIRVYHLETDIIEMRLSRKSDHENFFFLHFELKEEAHARGLYNEMTDSLKKQETRKSIRVLLSCTSGLTTGFFAQKLNDAAKTLSIDCEFYAVEYAKLYSIGFDYDVILLAPQIGYQLKKAREIFADQCVISVPAVIFASYDAGAMLTLIEEELQKKRDSEEQIVNAEVMRDIDLNAMMFVINMTQEADNARYLTRLYEAGRNIISNEVIKERDSYEDIFDILDTELRSLRKNFSVDAVSISVPGHLRSRGKSVSVDYARMSGDLSEHCGLPVYVHHNTSAVAYGFYAGQGRYDIVSYHSQPRGALFGGQGSVCRGMPIDGRDFMAGEFGPFFARFYPDLDLRAGSVTRENIMEVLVGCLIANISVIAPEVILIRSDLTPDMDEIREELKKHMDEKNIPDLIHVRDIREYALLGTLLYGMREFKSSVRKLVRESH